MTNASLQQNTTFFTYIYMCVVRVSARVVPLIVVFSIFFVVGGIERVSAMTLSGTLYADEGVTAIASGKTVKIAVGTTTTSLHSTTSNGSGVWNFDLGAVTVPTSTPIVIWVDGDTTTRAALITKASSSVNNITGLDLYQNRVIVRHEGVSGTSTILNDLAIYDSTYDSDIQYTASTTHKTLTILNGQELHIWSGNTFTAPASTTIYGNFHNPGGVFAHGTGTITFASTTAATISGTSTGSSAFYNVVINGPYTMSNTVSITNLTINSSGSLTAPASLTVSGSYTNSGTFTNGNAFHFSGAGGPYGTSTGFTFDIFASGNDTSRGITSDGAYFYVVDTVDDRVYRYTLSGTYLDSFSTSGAGAASANGIDTDGRYLYVADFGDDLIYRFTLSGTFVDSFSTAASGNTDAYGVATDGTYIYVTDRAGAQVYRYTLSGTYQDSFDTAASGNADPVDIATDGTYLYIADLADAEVYRYTLSGTYLDSFDTAARGNGLPFGVVVEGAHIYTTDYGDDLVYQYSLRQNIMGTLTGTSDLGNVIFSGSSNKAFLQSASTTDLIISTATVTAPTLLTIQGDYVNEGTFLHNNGTIYMGSTTATNIVGDISTTSLFNNLTIKNGDHDVFLNVKLASPTTTESVDGLGVFFIDPESDILSVFGSVDGRLYQCNMATRCRDANNYTSTQLSFSPSNIVKDEQNEILYLTTGSGLYRCPTSTGCNEDGDFAVATTGVELYAIAIDETNGVLYAGGGDQSGEAIILRCVLSTACDSAGDFTVATGLSALIVQGLAVDGTYGTLYVGMSSTGDLYRCALSTGCDAPADFTLVFNPSDSYFKVIIDSTYNNLFLEGNTTYHCALSTGCDEAGDFTNLGYFTLAGLVVDATRNILYADGYKCDLSTSCDSLGEFETSSYITGSTMSAVDPSSGTVFGGSSADILLCLLCYANSGTSTVIQQLVVETGLLSFSDTVVLHDLQVGTLGYVSLLGDLYVSGNYVNNGTSSITGSVVFNGTSTQTLSGNLVDDSSFDDIYFTGVGSKTFSNNASTTGDFSIRSGSAVVAPSGLSILGDFTNDGTFTHSNGTIYLGYGSIASGTLSGSSALNNVVVATGTVYHASIATTTGGAEILAMTVDSVNKVLYTAVNLGSADSIIIRCELATSCDSSTDFTVATKTAGIINGLAIDSASSTLYMGSSLGQIYRCSLSTACDAGGDFTTATRTSETIVSLTVDPVNKVLYAGSYSKGILFRCAVGTGCDSSTDFTAVYDSAIVQIDSLAIDTASSTLYFGGGYSAGIYRCALSTNCDASGDFTSVFSNSSNYIKSISIDSVNKVLYAVLNGYIGDDGIIYRCPLSTGCDTASEYATVTVSLPAIFTGMEFTSSVIDEANQLLYVSGYFQSGSNEGFLYRCVLSTGCDSSDEYVQVTTDSLTNYPTVALPVFYELSIDPVYGGLYLTEEFGTRLYKFTPTTFVTNASTTNLTVNTSATLIPYQSLSVSGSYSNNGRIASPATTTFNGATAQAISGNLTNYSTFNNVLFTGAGTKTFGNSASTTNFIIESGSSVVAPSLLTIGGNFRNSGTFTSGATTTFSSSTNQTATGTMTAANGFNTVVLTGTSTKTFGANASTTNFVVSSMATAVLPPLLSISGNYTNNGTTTAGTGTTTFNGTSIQTATGTMTGTSAFYNLAIRNTSGAGSTTQSVVFGRGASTTGTFSMIASTSAQFLANSSSTFQNVSLRGASGQYVWLRSSVPGTQYNFYVPGTQEVITYVDVRDNNACSVTITATDGTNVNSGNNSCWTFIAAPTSNLSLSGTLYSDEGLSVVTNAKTISIAVGTTTTSVSATSTRPDGTWSFGLTGTTIATSTPVTIWIDGDATFRAALFTKASSTNSITGLDLYQNRVIVSHEGTSGTSTTIANMSFYDNDNDSDIQYNVATTTNTLTVFSNQELHIKSGKTFAPGGNVTINANASTTSQTDGNLHIADSATYTAGGRTMLGGNFMASSSATFTPGRYTTVMNATTTGKIVYPLTTSMGNMLFTSATGSSAYSFASSATTTNFYISTNATVTAPTLLTIQGDYANAGGFIHNNGTVRMASSSVHSILGNTATSSPFNNLVISGTGAVDLSNYLSRTATSTAATSILVLAVDEVNQVLYGGSGNTGLLFRCALATGCDSGTDFTVATDTAETAVYSLAIDQVNGVLYAGGGGSGLIFRCVLTTNCDGGTDFTVATDTSESVIYSLGIDQVNGVLYAGSGDNQHLYRCEFTTGCDSGTDFTDSGILGGQRVSTISIDQVNGVIYLGDEINIGVYRCEFSTGCDIAGDFTGTFPSFAAVTSVIDTTNGVLYMGDAYAGTLNRCVLSTGCDQDVEFTVAFTDPVVGDSGIYSLAIDQTNGVLFLGTYSSGSLFACMLSSGCDSDSDFSFASDTPNFNTLAVDQSRGVLYGQGSSGVIFNCVLCQGTSTKSTSIGSLTIDNNATIRNNEMMRISGAYTNNGTSSPHTSTSTATYVFTGSSAQTISGTLTGTSSLPYTIFTGSGTKTFSSYASTTGDVTIGAGSTVAIQTGLSLGRNFESYGTINNSGTLYFTELGTNATGTLTDGGALGDVSIQPTGDLFTVATDTAESLIQALAIDQTNGVLYAGTSADGLIFRCVLSTSCDSTTDFTVATNTGTGLIHGMIVDQVNQVLYAGSGSAGWIFRCALSTGCDSASDFTLPFATTSATLATVRAFTIDTTNQVLYAGTGSGGIILRCVLSTGCDAASEFTIAADTTTTIVYSLDFDAINGVLYLGTGGTGIVLRCAVSTSCDALAEFTTATDTPETSMYATVVDAVNGVLYVGSGNNGRLYRCILSTACDSTGDFLLALDATPSIIRSLVIDTANNILYAGSQTSNGYIYRCVLSTGCDTESDFTTYTDTGEATIYSMAFNPGDKSIYVGAGDTNGYILRRSGGFTFGVNASTTDLTIGTSSTLVAPAQLTIGGNYTNSGTFTNSGGTVTFASSTWESVYTGTSYSTTGSGNTVPVGIVYVDGYFYVVDNTDALVYKYTTTGTYTGTSFAVQTTPLGLTYGNGFFWVSEGTGDEVYKHTSTGTYANSSFDTSGSGNQNPGGLVFAENYFWVTDSADALVYKYTAIGTYTGVSFDTAGSGSVSPTSITYANGYFYITDDSQDEVYVYTSNGVYTGISFDTAGSGNGSPGGITYANGALWITDYVDGAIYKYTLAQTLSGTLTASSTFNNLVFGGATPKAFANYASTTHLTIATTSGEVSMPQGLTIAGNYINSTTTGFRSNDGIVYFASSSAQTLAGTMIGSSAFGTTSFLGAGTKTFAHNASTTSFVASSSSGAIIAPPHLTIMGNYTNSSTFTAGSGTTTIGGYATQTLSGTMTGSSAFNNLQITNTSGAGSSSQSVRFLASASTTDTFTMIASTSAQFLAGATSTFQNIKLSGASGQNVFLRSSTPGTQYGFYVPGTQKTVSYVDVRDSSACPTLILATDGTNVDSGNNTCWSFASANATIVSDAHQVFAYLQATTTISPITITDDSTTASITAGNDIRLIIATSTTNMRWDTTDVTPTFAGTASGKVSATVSYAGDGAILIVDVTSDFTPGDTLGISDLSYARFETVSPATVALGVRTSGAGTSTNNSDSKTVTITGTLAIGSHSSGQINNVLTSRTVSGGELLAFKLTPAGETIQISNLAFPLKGVQGIQGSELTNVSLYRDMNSDQSYDAGDVAVGGAGSVSVNGQTGTLTFSQSFDATTTQDYLLLSDVAEVMPTDSFLLSLASSDMTSTGATSLVSITESGSISDFQHIKGGQGAGGGGGAIGGDAPAGDGIRTGGGGGGGDDIDPNSGDTIGHEVGFRAPATDSGSWTNGGNAYSSDGAYATANSSVSHGYGLFGFSVPSNNQVTGIVVKLEASGSTAAGTISVLISWDGGSSFSDTKTTSALGLTDAVFELGSPSDTWGRSWSPSDFNDGNIVVAVVANPSSNTLRIDAIQVRVYHQATGGGGGGGGAVFKEPNRFFANVYSAVGNIWEENIRSFLSWLRVE